MSQASPSQQRIIAQRYGIDLSEDNQNPETVLGNPGIPLTLETTQEINQDDLEKPSEQTFELNLKDKPSNKAFLPSNLGNSKKLLKVQFFL